MCSLSICDKCSILADKFSYYLDWHINNPELMSFHSITYSWKIKCTIHKICRKANTQKSLSRVWLFATPWIVAHQAPRSMGFSRHEYWSGLPFPSPEKLKNCPIHTEASSLMFTKSNFTATWRLVSRVFVEYTLMCTPSGNKEKYSLKMWITCNYLTFLYKWTISCLHFTSDLGIREQAQRT